MLFLFVKIYVLNKYVRYQIFKLKTAHPSRPSGRKGIAKRRETLKNRKEYAYYGRTLRRDLSLKIGDFFLQPHHSLRYLHNEAQKYNFYYTAYSFHFFRRQK
jgi:hypothetical protein